MYLNYEYLGNFPTFPRNAAARTCPEILLRWSAGHWDKSDGKPASKKNVLSAGSAVRIWNSAEAIRVSANETTLMNNLSNKRQYAFITFSETQQTNKQEAVK